MFVVWIALAVIITAYLTWWISFTVTRLDRLHARVDAAQAALDAQLVRRAAALDRLRPDGPEVPRLTPPLTAADRQQAENDVGRAVTGLLREMEGGAGGVPTGRHADVAELRETTERVHLARLFYDDAVRDTRILRERRLSRVLHLAGRREVPPYFDIDDTVPPLSIPGPARVGRPVAADPRPVGPPA